MRFLLYITIGFVAQLIDGTLGMAYGVSCRTFLRQTTGVSAATASAVVHVAELPVSGISALSHLWEKNIQNKLLIPLIISGILGGVAGAGMVTSIGNVLEPVISFYLFLSGMKIFINAFKSKRTKLNYGKWIYLLGMIGGFLDATGGGGWGPVVAGTLIGKDNKAPKYIGTVNVSEFFIVCAESITFVTMLGEILLYYKIIIGLIVGGVIAAPIAAKLCNKISTKLILVLVGMLLMIINLNEMIALLI